MSWVMFIFGYIAVCFLLKTLINKQKLGKRNFRIQLITEVVWIVIFVAIGLYML